MRLGLTLLCLALAVGQVFAGPREAFAAALADCRKLPPDEARVTRYFWRPGGYAAGEREVMAVHVNQLSRSAILEAPRVVNDEILAVRIDDYRWDAKVWEKLADTEPYFTVRTETQVTKYFEAGVENGKPFKAGNYPVKQIAATMNPRLAAPGEQAEFQRLTGSIVPVVRADWWVSTTARQVNLRNKDTGVGYYDWLGVKKRDDFLKLSRFTQADSEALGRHVRGVLDRSGVAQHGRQLAGFDALTGKVFMTLDAETLEQDNLPTELLKPGAFKHQAEEWYLQAPNGLWYFGLFSDKGVRQATAPDFIGPDDSKSRIGRDGRIHVCLSCIRCHTEDGLKPVDEWARRTFRGRVRNDITTRDEQQEFKQLYLSNLNRQLDQGRLIYRGALAELNGVDWTGAKNAEAFSRFYNRYAEEPVAVKQLAVELGLTEQETHARLKAARLPISLGPWLQEDGVVRRETVEDFWAVLILNVLEAK